MSGLSGRVPGDYSPNPLALLLEEKRRRGRSVLDLTITNPTRLGFPTLSPRGITALADPRAAGYDPDPRGSAVAREAIAAYYRGRGGGTGAVPPERIFLTASTSEAYGHLLRLLCDPGDEILVPRPSYPLLEPLARLSDVCVHEYRLAYDGRWRLDLDSVEGSLGAKTRAIVLVEPNNPTGSCLSPEEFKQVEALCRSRGIALISDEVFGDYPWPPQSAPLRSRAGERGALTFVLNGISKLCGLPQLKLGWIAIAGPEDSVRRVAPGLEWIGDLYLSVGAPVQLALPLLLEERALFQSAVTERMRANLENLRGRKRRDGAYTLLEGAGGWSAVLRFRSSEADLAERALERHDVLLYPGHFYDLPDEGDAVVSLLTEPAVLGTALDRLALLV